MNIAVLYPELIDAVVLFAPVSSDYKDNFLKWRKRRFTAEELANLEQEFGPLDQTDSWEDFSAMSYFEMVDDPFMIHHGTKDESVPLQWSHDTKARLQAEGKTVIYYEYEEEKHEFTTKWNEVMQRTLAFFDEYIKNK